jgi:hypothetical protein
MTAPMPVSMAMAVALAAGVADPTAVVLHWLRQARRVWRAQAQWLCQAPQARRLKWP